MTSKRSKHELRLPGLTPAMRALAIDPACKESDRDAEYHAFLTVRGAKIRAGQHVGAWVSDPKMPENTHVAEAMVAGIRNNPDSEAPSPYEFVVDLVFFSSFKQLCPEGHDYLIVSKSEVYEQYLSSGAEKHRVLINWPGVVWGSCVRDTVHSFFVRDGEVAPKDNNINMLVTAYAELQGKGKQRKVRAWTPFHADCTEAEMLSLLPTPFHDILPKVEAHYIRTATSFTHLEEDILPMIRRESGRLIGVDVDPGSPVQAGCQPADLLMFGIKTKDCS
jgi:hypothetical protein